MDTYEQKYKEALERAKDVKNGLCPHDSSIATVEYIFPELRESEDEKVRALLVSLVQWAEIFPQSGLDSDTTNKMLSYLEKQKERGPLTKEEEYTLQRIIEYLEDETCPPEWISLLHDIYCLPYEKQKEQKPAQQNSEEVFNKIDSSFRKGREVGFREGMESARPAEWSEGDEKMLWSAINGLNIHIYEKERAWLANKLKSLRPQPKQEWSEEDEKKILFLERLIKYHVPEGRYGYIDKSVTKLQAITMLKSLHPFWKPSDEQMDALKELIDDVNRAGWVTPGATELYEQLKKL